MQKAPDFLIIGRLGTLETKINSTAFIPSVVAISADSILFAIFLPDHCLMARGSGRGINGVDGIHLVFCFNLNVTHPAPFRP